MKTVLAIMVAFIVSGCAMPSFYDDNESLLAVDVRVAISDMDCANPYIYHVQSVVNRLYFYVESKESEDIGEMVKLMKETVDAMASKPEMSIGYCNVKKKLLEKQSKDITSAIMGRY